MPYAFVQDVPIDANAYRTLREDLGPETPKGLVVHVVSIQPEGGLSYLDVWESKEDWEHFAADRLHPALGRFFERIAIEFPEAEPPLTIVEVIDVWAS